MTLSDDSVTSDFPGITSISHHPGKYISRFFANPEQVNNVIDLSDYADLHISLCWVGAVDE